MLGNNKIEDSIKALQDIDFERIYLENLRSLFNLSIEETESLCERALQENVFTMHYGILCPNDGQIIKTFTNDIEKPETVFCEICEALERDKHEFKINECEIMVFYKLV